MCSKIHGLRFLFKKTYTPQWLLCWYNAISIKAPICIASGVSPLPLSIQCSTPNSSTWLIISRLFLGICSTYTGLFGVSSRRSTKTLLPCHEIVKLLLMFSYTQLKCQRVVFEENYFLRPGAYRQALTPWIRWWFNWGERYVKMMANKPYRPGWMFNGMLIGIQQVWKRHHYILLLPCCLLQHARQAALFGGLTARHHLHVGELLYRSV